MKRRNLTILILVSISAMCFGQAAPQQEVQFDTIATTEASKEVIAEILPRIIELNPKYAESRALVTEYESLSKQLMLVVSALIDPKELFVGFTAEHDLLKKKL